MSIQSKENFATLLHNSKVRLEKNQFFPSVARARLNLVVMKRNSRAYQTYLTCDVAITQIQEPFTACFWYTLMLIVFMDIEEAPLE